ncbi:hypothetical protein ZYGR_0H04940 [Zygosaccharomyces rouxii]|uniref:ZYRO0B15378p n=2 Tax=Zygosaccharomyces rouxii TaxID=4956 RepID=C5DSB3_ZYGRC|nr:uncharacterized protein ZYRO0B15378g [Zygosaccharomyces rouxii]KAH9199798.1 hypothetical protein LQ764DRAFT_108081 [Zygosaccharomyces rouxii]GAV47648.1 hypothetical protein ZYGR_0H04940 [Zygosaccharomyces rouxii]CAR26674.1 ZYRO0B15378p [Zygosaccharomyces rouxii]
MRMMDANALKVASTVPESSQDPLYLSTDGLVKRISSGQLSSDEGSNTSGGGSDDSNSSSGGSDDSSSGGSDSDDSTVHKSKNDHTVGVAVGVAVGVPVFLVLVLLGILIWILYRRNKREAKNDHDPDFTGDIEDLSNLNQLYDDSHSSSAADEVKEMDDSDSYLPPRVKQRMTRQRIQSVDPFRIPERNDTTTIREFGRQHDDAYGPYKIAANNNNLSSYELSYPRGGHHSYTFNALTSKEHVHVHNAATSRSSSISEGENADGEQEEEMLSVRQSPVKSVVGQVTKQYAEGDSGLDASESRLDDSAARSRDALIQKNRSGEDKEPESNETSFEVGNEDETVPPLSEREEEDIKRMKSIYKVYYENRDKNKDIEKDMDTKVGQYPDLPTLDPSAGNEEQPPEPQQLEQPKSSNLLTIPGGNQDALAQRASSIYSAVPTHASVDRQNLQHGQQLTLEQQEQQLQQQEQQLRLQQQQWQQEEQQFQGQYPMQQPIYDAQAYASPQFFSQPSFTPQQYAPSQFSSPMQYAPPQSNYGYSNMPQRAHPQTLESIDELPTPTNLPYSSSSLSLTSFKSRGRQLAALPALQAARVHGTALNPMDHPELFYAHNDDTTQTGSPLAPYKMRQSVVMTNPSELTLPTNFRPAGSIRNVSGMNTRNNSITTQMNPYYRQQAAYNSRVSGLLAEEDVLQPPSTGGILPHTGSNDDLRRQLGSSHNYKIV